jgi:hypothetical protein
MPGTDTAAPVRMLVREAPGHGSTTTRRERRPVPEAARSAGATTWGGRGWRENVTYGAMPAASAGPTPRTRRSPSSDPNGPRESRLATIRPARTGPIRGRRWISAAGATSRSIREGGRGGEGAAGAARRPGEERVTREERGRAGAAFPIFTFAAAAWRAESTAWSWRSRAKGSSGWSPNCGSFTRSAAEARTVAPRTRRVERKRRARRSEGVGMGGMCGGRGGGVASDECGVERKLASEGNGGSLAVPHTTARR